MRAANRSAVAVPAHRDAAGLALRLFLVCVAVIALLLTWLPSVVKAQAGSDSSRAAQGSGAPFTVVKRPGETLHELALRFYGDSTRWREIAGANGMTSVTSRHLVAAGTRVVLPGKTAAQVAATTRASTPAPRTPSLASQTAGKGNADSARAAAARRTPPAQRAAATPPRRSTPPARTTPTRPANAATAAADTARRDSSRSVDERPLDRAAVRVGLVNAQDARAARGKDEPTIFMGRPAGTASEIRAQVAAVQEQSRAAAPRTGEYVAAPYAVESVRFDNAGRIVRRLNGAGPEHRDMPRNVRLADEAIITLPRGMTAEVGQRLVSVHKGPAIGGRANVAVPTGVFQIVRAGAGQPVAAKLIRQMGIVDEQQTLLVAEGSPMAPDVRPVVTNESEISTRIHFILGDQLLPTLQTYIVFEAGEAQGVRQGDEFWIVERVGEGAAARERRIAVVRIVRTTPFGSTGVVTDQDQPGIAVGASARRVARVASSD